MGHVRAVALVAAAAVVLASLPGLNATWPGRVEAATSSDPGDRLHDGAKGFGDSLLGGIKFVGRTIISPFTGKTHRVGRDADATGKQLHQGSKEFGEGLLGGLKHAGRKIGDFFNGSDEKNGR